MKKLAFVLLLALILPLAVSCGTDAESGFEGFCYYVNLSAESSGDGSENSPFAAITEARDAIRRLKADGGLPAGGVTVFVSGVGKIRESVIFTEEDSGEEGKPIVYKSTDGAVLDGGVTLDYAAFVSASEAPGEIFDRLPEGAKDKVLAIDLVAAGCYDIDDSKTYGTGWSSSHYRQKLYVNGKSAVCARYPNIGDGYAEIALVGSTEDKPGKTAIPAEKAVLWQSAAEMRMFAYPEYDWNGKHYSVEKVDSDGNVLTFDSEEGYRVNDGGTYFVYNLPEELDEVGEYYWDTETNYLYYYPAEDFSGSQISFSQLYGHIIETKDTDYLTFDGLTFENYRGCAISVDGDGVQNFGLLNCKFTCGQYGVSLTGRNIVLDRCEFSELGGRCAELDGITEDGGDDLGYAAISVTNCLFHDYAQDYRVYNPALGLYGCGITVSHNEIYSAPHSAIISVARDSVIEYNRIHDVCREVDDCGAIYIGDRWDVKGTEINYNYIYNINDTTNGRSPNGIHLDDETSDIVCIGNILANIGGDAFRIGGGRGLRLENNISVDIGGFSVHIDDRGIDWHSTGYDADTDSYGKSTDTHNWRSDLWRYRFPGLQILAEIPEPTGNFVDEPGIPAYNLICGNVVYGYAGTVETPENEGFYGNMHYFAGMEICDLAIKYGSFGDNILYTENPGFSGFGEENFSVADDSRIYRDVLGFSVIGSSEVGITK